MYAGSALSTLVRRGERAFSRLSDAALALAETAWHGVNETWRGGLWAKALR